MEAVAAVGGNEPPPTKKDRGRKQASAAVPEEEVHRDREERPGDDAEGQRRIEDAGEREGEDDADREEDQVRAFHAASCEPKRPAGRTRRMTARRAKTMTFSIAGSKIAPTLARRPARKPAATAPAIEPRPPMTTTANVRMMSSEPMSGDTLRMGAASTPASAASAIPNAKTPVIQRSTSMPSARVSSVRSVAARTTMPRRVRSMTYQTATQTASENAMTKRRYAG